MSTITSGLFSRFSDLADFSSPIAHVSQTIPLHKKILGVVLISMGLIALAYIFDPYRKVLDAQGNGQGRISYFFGAMIYEGTFKNRKLIQGIQRFSFGFAKMTYEGTFKENKLNGPGEKSEYVYGFGSVTSVGVFKDNRLNDPQGKRTHSSSGLVEEGIFEDDHLVRGKHIFSDGVVREGIFKKHQLDGEGTINLTNGTIIKGTFKSGYMDGQVTFYLPSGMIIKGIATNKQLNGKARVTLATGLVSEAIFKNNKIIKIDGQVIR